MLFNRNIQKVYIDTDSPPVATDAMLDVILSPVYYWVKRQTLPVRYLREAKRLLPSLFEDTLPKGHYSYSAYKEGEHYLLFAYSDRLILDALAEKGIKPSQIHRIYFAQSEFGEMRAPLQVDAQHALALQGGIVVKLPLQFTTESVPLDLESHKVSSHDIDLARYAHIADQRSIARFSAFMAVLTLLFAAEWGIVSAKTAGLEERRAAVYGEYGLPSTSMQNAAILQRLERRFGEQTALRDATAKLFGVRLSAGEHLTHYGYEAGSLKASFEIATRSRADAVTAALKRDGLTFTQNYADGTLQLEVKL